MRRDLIPLGEGVYTVSEVCRILRPSMTPRKVHYWLNTGLLSEPPVAHRGSGVPTLLTFRQLLEVRTVQHLRDEIGVSLPKVREAFHWLLTTMFGDIGGEVRFELGPGPSLIVSRSDGDSVVVPTGQGAFPMAIDDINAQVSVSRAAWRDQALDIPDHPALVADARVSSGSPTVRGTRVEAAVLAAFAGPDRTFTTATVDAVLLTYPYLSREAISDAMRFEGLHLVA